MGILPYLRLLNWPNFTFFTLGFTFLLGLAAPVRAQNCKEDEPGLLPSRYEELYNTPYCRSKVGTRTREQIDTGLYWPFEKRRISVAPYYESFTPDVLAGDTTLEQVMAALRKSADTWNRAAVSSSGCSDLQLIIDTSRVASDTNRYQSIGQSNFSGDGINAIVMYATGWEINCEDILDPAKEEICFDTPQDMVLAATQTIYNTETGEIIDADIAINGQFFKWVVATRENGYVDPDPACDEVNGVVPNGCINIPQFSGETGEISDLQSVMTHELGHLLGFAHVSLDSYDSMMYWSNNNIRELAEGDIIGLCATYPTGRPTPGNLFINYSELNGRLGCAVSPSGSESYQGLAIFGAIVLGLFLRRTRLRRRAHYQRNHADRPGS